MKRQTVGLNVLFAFADVILGEKESIWIFSRLGSRRELLSHPGGRIHLPDRCLDNFTVAS